jgi:hypothetical protein
LRRDGWNGEQVGEGRRAEKMERAKRKKRRKGIKRIDQRGRTSDPVTGPYPRYPFGSWKE